MSLSDTAVRNAKAKEAQYKLMDDLGLYLMVRPNGSKLWRMDYQFAGKRKTLSFGPYPAVRLADARRLRDEARQQIQVNVDPSLQKKLDRITDAANLSNTFGLIADEVLAKLEKKDVAPATITKKRWMLKTLAADLSDRPISEIKSVEILSVLQHVERLGRHESAVRLKSEISAVFRLAVATMRAEGDPTSVLRGAIVPPVVRSHAAIVDEKAFGALMDSIERYDGFPTIRYALKFLALTAARPGEVRFAEWDEFDLAKRIWTIPAKRTKMRREHTVALSHQAAAVISQTRALLVPHDKFVFSSIRSGKKSLSENTMNAALRRLGYTTDEHVSHGFRSSFSTIMNERGYDPEVIEHALAHKDSSVRGIYNRSKYWDDRVALMQAWADLIDDLIRPKPQIFEDLF